MKKLSVILIIALLIGCTKKLPDTLPGCRGCPCVYEQVCSKDYPNHCWWELVETWPMEDGYNKTMPMPDELDLWDCEKEICPGACCEHKDIE